jgi:signal transduction histidine kinase/ActR/RegA family two-component response regulator
VKTPAQQKTAPSLSGWIRKRFLFRLFVVFTVISLVSITVFIFLFMQYQNRTLSQGLFRHGKLLSEILAHNARLGVFSENKEMLKDLVNGISGQESVLYVDLYNGNGEKLIQAKKENNRVGEISIRPFESYGRNEKIFRVSNEKDYIEFWSPVISRTAYFPEESFFIDDTASSGIDQIIGYTRIIIGKKQLRRRIKSLSLRIVVAALLFWIAGSSLIFIIVKRLTDPLNRLTGAVLKMGETGDIEQVPIETKDEIGDLSIAFNKMSASLVQREHEKKRLEDQLRLAQKMEAIGTLAGGIAHDFNNLLGAIIGYSELALLEADGNETQRDRIIEILAAGNRGSDLVRQILTFSRQSEKSRNPIQAGVIIKEVLKLLKPSLPGNIRIKTDIDPACGMVVSDATAVHQIVMNLCANAVHAMKETPGNIEVILCDIEIDGNTPEETHLIPPGRYQKLSVIDEGHGIKSENRERIFDPFFTTKGMGEGTGMGLSVVHGIIMDHEGFISMDSEPGKGTRFDVYLPRLDPDGVPRKRKAEAAPAHGSETILLVDDEKALAKSTQGILESLGYQVFVAGNGMDALDQFKDHPDRFDLIISDMAMPQMTGLELSAAVLDIRPDVPIILITGFSDLIDEKKAERLGIGDILQKPVVRNKLAAVVRKVLDESG